MTVAELTPLKTVIFLGVRAEDADAAVGRAVAVYKAFIGRLYEQNIGVRGIRIDVQDPVQRKERPELWECNATMRSEVPGFLRAPAADNYLDAWRTVVRTTWAQVTRELEQDVHRGSSFIALTRPVVPGEDQAQGARPEEPKRFIGITVHFKGEVHKIEVPDSDTLLDGCLDKGVPLKFQCKAGVCDECQVKVLSGMENLPPVNDAEINMLGDRIKEGYRLSCQFTIKGPVEIKQD